MFCTSFLVNFSVVVMQFSFIVKHLALLLSALAQHRHLIRMRVLLWCTKMSCSFLCNRKIVAFVLKKYSALKTVSKNTLFLIFPVFTEFEGKSQNFICVGIIRFQNLIKEVSSPQVYNRESFFLNFNFYWLKGKKQLHYITQTYD